VIEEDSCSRAKLREIAEEKRETLDDRAYRLHRPDDPDFDPLQSGQSRGRSLARTRTILICGDRYVRLAIETDVVPGFCRAFEVKRPRSQEV
jgi:hypothetical protein